MNEKRPRGIAVVDVGATNIKAVLFDGKGNFIAERKTAAPHRPPPPYAYLDPEPTVDFFRASLPQLDRLLPLDKIVPTAHGAALACLAADGSLALPVMDYSAEPPQAIVEAYRRIEPPFEEVFGPLLPMALTHGLQLFWQETGFPELFRNVATIMTWIQYVGFRLSGAKVSEISSLACQSQLMDVRRSRFSSLARNRGWDKLFPPMARAWDDIGPLKPEFRGSAFRGEGRVLAGVHDSNANYLRYLAAGLGSFTLLSTGTWIIGFDTRASLDELVEERDTVSNTDVLGRTVACCRFFGGREFEIIAEGAAADAASLAAVNRLIAQGTFALPSFTDSGGPMPGTGGKGRIIGPPPETAEDQASLAALYCALMCDQSLDAIGSKSQIIVDGPFAANQVFLGLLAGLRGGQDVLASALSDGTAAGAAVLAFMARDGSLPRIGLDLAPITAASVAGLPAYAAKWMEFSRGSSTHEKIGLAYRQTPLPNAERAILDIGKLENYCLSPAHPRGRHKARVFRESLGIGRDDAPWFREVLLSEIGRGAATAIRTDDFGTHWRSDILIQRQGKRAVVRTLWIVRHGEYAPRFVTCWVV
jgi:sugar (pentulose or hexulose) kinase